MSDSALIEQFKQGLLTVLDETFENVHGIFLDRNTSLFETLATVSAEEASRPVGQNCATLAAQVEHVRFYIDVLMKFLQTGQNERVDWGEIWRTVSAVTSEEWEQSKTRLRDAYQRLTAMIKGYSNWAGMEAFAGAIGLAAHCAYHLGEIRQALCAVKNPV
jgi:hypothetical protein